MRSDIHGAAPGLRLRRRIAPPPAGVARALAAGLMVMLALAASCRGADKPTCEVAVAALNLPAGSSGLLHWRAGDTATTPLQLSTRYFSDRLKLPGQTIAFYQDPVPAGPATPPAPVPLLTVVVPAGVKLAYLVLWSEPDPNRQCRWHASVFNAADWSDGSMRVLNACTEPIGISAGDKRLRLTQGKSADFAARDWAEPFPVKIFRLEPETKLVFSSTWRVTAGRRELCFIGNLGGAVSLRSLLDLGAQGPAAPP